ANVGTQRQELRLPARWSDRCTAWLELAMTVSSWQSLVEVSAFHPETPVELQSRRRGHDYESPRKWVAVDWRGFARREPPPGKSLTQRVSTILQFLSVMLFGLLVPQTMM